MDVQLLIQFLTNAPRKSCKDGPFTLIPSAFVEHRDLAAIALVIVAVREVNQ